MIFFKLFYMIHKFFLPLKRFFFAVCIIKLLCLTIYPHIFLRPHTTITTHTTIISHKNSQFHNNKNHVNCEFLTVLLKLITKKYFYLNHTQLTQTPLNRIHKTLLNIIAHK